MKKVRKNYRKIYEAAYGAIPVDPDGNTYDIHHIDGNIENNDHTNLIALSRKDHYDVHFSQQDWAACQAILVRMGTSTDELRKLAKASNQKRVDNGTHHLLGGKQQSEVQTRLVKEGKHHFLGGKMARHAASVQLSAGKNKLVGGEIQRKTNASRISDGSHHLLGPNHNIARMKNGTHPTQIKISCTICCREISGVSAFNQHFDSCVKKAKAAPVPKMKKKSGSTQIANGTNTSQRLVSCTGCRGVFSALTFTRHTRSPKGCFSDK